MKLGKVYEALVADVMRALHPGATVKVGEWVIGPDGDREIDVAIRGEIEGKETFILVECKDWKRRVDIGSIDALDSKRKDVGADRTIIASNGGFTGKALRKAERISIGCVAALADGNPRIQFEIGKVLFAKLLSVDRYQWILHFEAGFKTPNIPLEEITLDGLHVACWLRDKARDLLQQHQDAPGMKFEVAFKPEAVFKSGADVVPLKGIGIVMEFKKTELYQETKQSVSLGLFDFLKNAVVIPPNEAWSFIIDQEAWKPLPDGKAPAEISDLEPNSIDVRFGLFRLPFQHIQGDAPKLDSLILEDVATVVSPVWNLA
jgi:hypothetical protein